MPEAFGGKQTVIRGEGESTFRHKVGEQVARCIDWWWVVGLRSDVLHVGTGGYGWPLKRKLQRYWRVRKIPGRCVSDGVCGKGAVCLLTQGGLYEGE
jgi:hypothetical protein